ncbi:helix-turn-helix domain-containing protein [Kitasatospora sp. NPDC058263]
MAPTDHTGRPEPTIGENLSRLRSQAGLTRAELSAKSGVAVPTIKGLEQNVRTTALMGTVSKLSRALDVKPSVLLGQRQTLHRDDGAREESVAMLRRAIHPLGGLPGVRLSGEDAEPPDAAALDTSVEQAWQQYHRGDFAHLIASLPLLLASARAAVRDSRGAGLRHSQAALSRCYSVAAQAAAHVGQDDLARTAVERSMVAADQAQDPVLVASGCNALSWVLLRQNEHHLAGQIAWDAADMLNPRFSRDNYQAVRMWGRLRLSSATAFSRQDDYQGAREMLDDAQRCTLVVDLDAVDYVNGGHNAAFGQSKVAMVRTEVAMAQHRPAEALRAAGTVSPTTRIPPMTRSRHLLDVAHAQTWEGQYADAVGTLTRVHGMAPEWMRYQVLAREVVRLVQDSKGRRRIDGLAPLLRHMNLIGA